MASPPPRTRSRARTSVRGRRRCGPSTGCRRGWSSSAGGKLTDRGRQETPFTAAYRVDRTTLVAYTLLAYSAPMVFVELTPFVAFRDEYWTDEELRALQSFLLVSPEAGALIRRGGTAQAALVGARTWKARWGEGDLLLARPQVPDLPALRLCEEQARGPDPTAGQGTCRTDEGPEGWIRSTSINWSRAWAR